MPPMRRVSTAYSPLTTRHPRPWADASAARPERHLGDEHRSVGIDLQRFATGPAVEAYALRRDLGAETGEPSV
jgi:hypothetical protein